MTCLHPHLVHSPESDSILCCICLYRWSATHVPGIPSIQPTEPEWMPLVREILPLIIQASKGATEIVQLSHALLALTQVTEATDNPIAERILVSMLARLEQALTDATNVPTDSMQ